MLFYLECGKIFNEQEDVVMKAKKAGKIIVATIATVAGVFGGMKLYSKKKQNDKEAIDELEALLEQEENEEVSED